MNLDDAAGVFVSRNRLRRAKLRLTITRVMIESIAIALIGAAIALYVAIYFYPEWWGGIILGMVIMLLSMPYAVRRSRSIN